MSRKSNRHIAAKDNPVCENRFLPVWRPIMCHLCNLSAVSLPSGSGGLSGNFWALDLFNGTASETKRSQMSHNHTDFEDQKKGHRGVLLGIAAVIIFVVVLFGFMQGDALSGNGEAQGSKENVEAVAD